MNRKPGQGLASIPLLLWFMGVALGCTEQSFQRIYPSGAEYGEQGGGVRPGLDGGYWVYGDAIVPSHDLFRTIPYVVKTDTVGSADPADCNLPDGVCWRRIHYLEPDETVEIKDLIELSGGDVALAGYRISKSYTDQAGLLIRIDRNSGDIVWQRRYGAAGVILLRSVVELANGDLMVLGRTQSPAERLALVVMRLTPTGDVLWQLELDDPEAYGLNPVALARTEGGDFVVLGDAEVDADPHPRTRAQIYLAEVSEVSELRWWTTYGQPDEIEQAAALVIEEDRLVVGGVNFGLPQDPMGVYLFTRKGEFLSFVPLQPREGYEYVDLERLRDGGYAAALRHVWNPLGLWEMVLVRLDAEFNERWRQNYGRLLSAIGGEMEPVVVDDIEGFAWAGYVLNPFTFNTQLYLVKADNEGNAANDEVDRTIAETLAHGGALAVAIADLEEECAR